MTFDPSELEELQNEIVETLRGDVQRLLAGAEAVLFPRLPPGQPFWRKPLPDDLAEDAGGSSGPASQQVDPSTEADTRHNPGETELLDALRPLVLAKLDGVVDVEFPPPLSCQPFWRKPVVALDQETDRAGLEPAPCPTAPVECSDAPASPESAAVEGLPPAAAGELTDELIQAARCGSTAALDKLLEAAYAYLQQRACRVVRLGDALNWAYEELVQQTLIAVAEQWPSFRGETLHDFRLWVSMQLRRCEALLVRSHQAVGRNAPRVSLLGAPISGKSAALAEFRTAIAEQGAIQWWSETCRQQGCRVSVPPARVRPVQPDQPAPPRAKAVPTPLQTELDHSAEAALSAAETVISCALPKLSADLQRVYYLHDVVGLTTQEISERLGCSTVTVERHSHLVRETFRRILYDLVPARLTNSNMETDAAGHPG